MKIALSLVRQCRTVVAMTAATQQGAAAPLITAAAADGLVLAVTSKKIIAQGVCQLTLGEPEGRLLPDWAPGAHIDLVLPGERVRQYSLCGDRWDPFEYRIAVLREPNGHGGSAYVHDELTIGQLVPVGGPRNNFHLVPATKYLFIAGGIGITPLLPMVDQACRLGIEWSLIYGGRSLQSMAYITELAAHGTAVILWPQDCKGLIDLEAALASAGPDTMVYCCGPDPLLTAMQSHCKDWPPGRLRIERFVPAPIPAPLRNQPFEVHLQRSNRSVTIGPGVSVLDALHKAGATVLSSCRRGVCGTCETSVVSGIPDHRDSLLSDTERAANDRMYPCVSRSCSDQLVLDL